jgi:hypothetical protein
VAALTVDSGMRAAQCKLRTAGVIEVHGLPRLRRMALLAFLPEAPAVRIVEFVTGLTSRGRTLESLACVT